MASVLWLESKAKGVPLLSCNFSYFTRKWNLTLLYFLEKFCIFENVK